MVTTRVRIGEYEAWVVVEDQEIEHYGIEVNEETKVATCWIESTAGKHFGIWVAKHHDKFDCRAKINLDGSTIRGAFLLKSRMKPKLRDFAHAGHKSGQPFLFGVLRLTDDESVLNSEQSYEDIGNIKVIFHRITDYKSSETPLVTHSRMPANDKIHERAKKTATHRVLLGQLKTVEKSRSLATFEYQEKVATFIFRYRSIDLLRANGIVPHDPPPVESVGTSASVSANSNSVSRKRKAVVKEEELADAEIDSEDEDCNRKVVELEAELEKLKARLDRKHPRKKVKRESRPVFLPGEVIDLTI